MGNLNGINRNLFKMRLNLVLRVAAVYAVPTVCHLIPGITYARLQNFFFSKYHGGVKCLLQTCCFMGICSVSKPEKHFCKLSYFIWKTFQLDVQRQLTVLWTKSFGNILHIHNIFSETIWYRVNAQDLQGQEAYT